MSGSVGTIRASSNRITGNKEKMAKGERNTLQQQQQNIQPTAKSEQQTNKVQPTQEQLQLARLMTTSQSVADENTVKELMELTGKDENAVVIALHDAENDADRAAMILMDGGDEPQGEWREQGNKRKKKANTSSKDMTDQTVEDIGGEGQNKDTNDRDGNRDRGSERRGMPPRRGRRNGGPPPRLARGRGRDRVNFSDRDRKEQNNTEEWDKETGDGKPDRGGRTDRGRSRGRGGYGGRRSGGQGGDRGRFNNSSDRDSRSYNRVPRYEKISNQQPMDGPEIDTWTNETAETVTNKDTDWDTWADTFVNEDDQWTGSLDETKVFTPSQMKASDHEPVNAQPQSSRGQRVDVGSLFIESANFPKAPDYSKPSEDAYINHFKQAATESIKNSIGIGSSSRSPHSLGSLDMQQQSMTNSLGLSNLAQNAAQGQIGVLSGLTQGPQSSMAQSMTQLSQMTIVSQESQIGNIGVQQVPSQSRMPSVIQQQQQQQQNMSITNTSNMQQRPKPQKSKLPPPSKIPASAVEMPGHIPHNPQLDLQFGIDFGSDSSSSFDFGVTSDNVGVVTSNYSPTPNETSSVITNHLSQTSHVNNNNNDASSMVSSIVSAPPSVESQQSNRSPSMLHSSVYASQQIESQPLDREQSKMSGSEHIPYSSQLEHKTGALIPQRSSQTNQNLNAGSLPQNKSETPYSPTNGYTSSYQSHQKSGLSQSQSYTHQSNSQPPQGSSFQGQYSASQSAYTPSAQSQFSNSSSATQFQQPAQPQAYSSQNQYSSGQNQFSASGSTSLPQVQNVNHQSQYSLGAQSSYAPSGQSQYSGYQSNSFTSQLNSSSQLNYSSNQTNVTGASMYPLSAQSSNSYSSQTNSYQQPSSGSYHSKENQTSVPVSTQASAGVSFQTAQQSSSSLKPTPSQTNTNYNSQNFSAPPVPLQTSPLANKLGESLAKISVKDSTLDGLQTSQYDHSGTSVTTAPTSMNLPSATSTVTISTGTTTTSATITATSFTSTSRIASMPSTSKAPLNLPPGVPLMGSYYMGQSTIPPFYSVQPPLYGYEDVQLLQQRMPLQTGNFFDMSAFPAPTATTLTAGRDQQPAISNVPFTGSYAPFLPLNTGTSADTSKMARVDAQSPNSATQPHSAAQQPLFNFHYGYYYPSMYATGNLQYPMFPMPPVTNTAAHAGTTANSQFPKNYTSHVYTTKGYDEMSQGQDFSKAGYGSSPTGGGKNSVTRTTSSDMTQNAYKSHAQTYDKQTYHGGTPPPFSLPLASATQAGPMGAQTAPYAAAPFLPVMAAHQLHHPVQQESNSSSSRGLNQTANQAKTGAAKSYGGQYWSN